MYALLKSLKACGYRGACENEQILTWAIRTGACSHFYNELLTWLETHLHQITCTVQVRKNIQSLFAVLRNSILMIPLPSETASNPKEYRLQTLKVLTHQLQLSLDKQGDKHVNESPRSDHGPKHHTHIRRLCVTLNMEKRSNGGDWNERLVRYSTNSLKMYE